MAKSYWWRGFLSLIIVAIVLVVADRLWPLPLEHQSDRAITVVAEDGTPLRAFADKQGVWRFKTSVEEVSPLYIQALLNYEDQYFYYHPGINPLAIIRAALQNIQANKIVSGGSTLTMQVARLIDPHARSYKGKFKQVFRSIQLEWHYSKDDILAFYLELAPFGGNLQGVEAASRAYFSKSALELSYAQAALLAILPQAPSRYRPDRHPQKARLARNKLVQRLVDNQIWSEQVIDEVKLEVVFAHSPSTPLVAPLLARRLLAENDQQSIIQSSIDYSLQLALHTRLKDYSAVFAKGTTAAAVIVDNENWLVKAYVGTAQFADLASSGYVDMVTATRSPGSTLKPFIYGLALDQSLIHSQSLLVDAPRWQSRYQPNNFSGRFHGAVSATQALQQSLNIPAVQLLEKLSPELFNNRLLNAGIVAKIPGGRANLSMALGGIGLSMQDLISLYGSLARSGKVAKLRFSSLQEIEERPLLSPQSAWIIYQMLSSQSRHDRPFSSAQTGWQNNLAFKTGTSYGYRDAWAVGVSGKYTLAVWIGRPDGTPSPGQYGAVTALPLLFQISNWLDDNSRPQKPTKISQATICWPSGLAMTDITPQHCHISRSALGIDGQFPVTLPATLNDNWTHPRRVLHLALDSGLRVSAECSVASSEEVISLWPLASEPWLVKKWQRNSLIPRLDERCKKQASTLNQQFSIVSLQNNSHLRNLASNTEFMLPLKTIGAIGEVTWYLDGYKLTLSDSVEAAELWLEPGEHELLAFDQSGVIDKLIFFAEHW